MEWPTVAVQYCIATTVHSDGRKRTYSEVTSQGDPRPSSHWTFSLRSSRLSPERVAGTTVAYSVTAVTEVIGQIARWPRMRNSCCPGGLHHCLQYFVCMVARTYSPSFHKSPGSLLEAYITLDICLPRVLTGGGRSAGGGGNPPCWASASSICLRKRLSSRSAFLRFRSSCSTSSCLRTAIADAVSVDCETLPALDTDMRPEARGIHAFGFGGGGTESGRFR